MVVSSKKSKKSRENVIGKYSFFGAVSLLWHDICRERERERERLARSLSIIFQNLYIAATLFLTMLRFFVASPPAPLSMREREKRYSTAVQLITPALFSSSERARGGLHFIIF